MPGSEKEYKFWSRHAGTHDNDVSYIVGHIINREVKGWLIDQFKDTDKVVELGCGTGIFSEMIADRVKNLTATDLSQEMIEQAKVRLSKYGNADVQIEDSYRTSFEENSFDAILIVNLLHIVKDPKAVLKESRRILKNSERVVIVDYTGHGMTFLKKIGLVIRYLRRLGKPISYNSNFTPDKLASIVKEAGFMVEESKLIGKDTKAVCLRARSS